MSAADGPHPRLLRGLQLKQLRRYADAESAFKEALAQDPNDAFALHQLADCQWRIPSRHKDALQTINQAIAVEPKKSRHHVLRAFILCVLDRPQEALATARAALGFDPNYSAAFAAEAQAHLQMGKWPLAEQSARQALALDADNSTAANQLAHALRRQNKQAENAAHLAGMLARDPENAFTQANAGWAALQRGAHREAETHFREALRLNPDSEYAREGLLNSFRARSPIYRDHLKYTFQRLSLRDSWAVFLGLYFGAVFLGLYFGVKVAPIIHGGSALVARYCFFVLFLFVLRVWVARPVGNFLLLFDPFAKFALRPREKIEAAVVCSGLLLGLFAVIAGLGFDLPVVRLAGIGLIASAFPLSLTFTNASRAGSWLFGIIGTVALLATLLVIAADWWPPIPPQAVVDIFTGSCIACFASTLLGKIPAFHKRG